MPCLVFLESTALITGLFFCQVYPFWLMRNVHYVEECFFEERVIRWNLLSMYEKFQHHRIWKRCSKEIWSYFVNKKSGSKVRLLSILYAISEWQIKVIFLKRFSSYACRIVTLFREREFLLHLWWWCTGIYPFSWKWCFYIYNTIFTI